MEKPEFAKLMYNLASDSIRNAGLGNRHGHRLGFRLLLGFTEVPKLAGHREDREVVVEECELQTSPPDTPLVHACRQGRWAVRTMVL